MNKEGGNIRKAADNSAHSRFFSRGKNILFCKL